LPSIIALPEKHHGGAPGKPVMDPCMFFRQHEKPEKFRFSGKFVLILNTDGNGL
jgi:hypothetical protein